MLKYSLQLLITLTVILVVGCAGKPPKIILDDLDEERALTESEIKENESDPDFFSAIKTCKRRRIGACREESNRPLFYKKDISILARSGFSYEISKKVLEIPKEEFKKFCKMV